MNLATVGCNPMWAKHVCEQVMCRTVCTTPTQHTQHRWCPVPWWLAGWLWSHVRVLYFFFCWFFFYFFFCCSLRDLGNTYLVLGMHGGFCMYGRARPPSCVFWRGAWLISGHGTLLLGHNSAGLGLRTKFTPHTQHCWCPRALVAYVLHILGHGICFDDP